MTAEPIVFEVPVSAAGPLLCMATHPMALALGTIPPMERCCAGCRIVPAGHPTTWTWPG